MNQMVNEVRTEHEKIAAAFLEEVVAGNIHDAYVKYVARGMRHHNPYYPGDAASLEKGMMENDREFPTKSIGIRHVIEEGNIVAVHSHVRMKDEGPEFATVHIFRFEGDKIAELWDIAQEVPEKSPNEYGSF